MEQYNRIEQVTWIKESTLPAKTRRMFLVLRSHFLVRYEGGWFRHLKRRDATIKVGNSPVPKRKLDDDCKKSIDQMWEKHTVPQMSAILKIPMKSITAYCDEKGYKPPAPPKMVKTGEAKSVKALPDEVKVFTRPPSEYTNRTRSQIVQDILIAEL